MTARPPLAFVLGIRPDLIRLSLLLEYLRNDPDVDVTLIWSGQHYSDNLKATFFRDLRRRLVDDDFARRRRGPSHLPTARAYGGDGLD